MCRSPAWLPSPQSSQPAPRPQVPVRPLTRSPPRQKRQSRLRNEPSSAPPRGPTGRRRPSRATCESPRRLSPRSRSPGVRQEIAGASLVTPPSATTSASVPRPSAATPTRRSRAERATCSVSAPTTRPAIARREPGHRGDDSMSRHTTSDATRVRLADRRHVLQHHARLAGCGRQPRRHRVRGPQRRQSRRLNRHHAVRGRRSDVRDDAHARCARARRRREPLDDRERVDGDLALPGLRSAVDSRPAGCHGIERDLGHPRLVLVERQRRRCRLPGLPRRSRRRLDGQERLHRVRARLRQELSDRGRRVRRGRQPLRQVGTVRHDEGLSTAAGTWSRRHHASVRPDRRERHLGHLVQHLARLDRFGGQRGRHRLRALSRRSRSRIVRADERDVLRSRLRPQLPARDRCAGRRRQSLRAGGDRGLDVSVLGYAASLRPAGVDAGRRDGDDGLDQLGRLDRQRRRGRLRRLRGRRAHRHHERACVHIHGARVRDDVHRGRRRLRRGRHQVRPGRPRRGDERLRRHNPTVDSQWTDHVRCNCVQRDARVECLH